MSDYKPLNVCLCCDGGNLDLALDLGNQPLANSYLTYKNEEEKTYPLAVNFCGDCTHVQLTHTVHPDALFKNYLYVSGTSKTLRDYFNWFVEFTSKYSTGKVVLDIACNDGTQLDAYKEQGYETYGIDPAENLYPLSSKEHKVVCDYLNKDSLSKLGKRFDIIVAQNVLAHNTYPAEFLRLCGESLNDNGYIFIQTSQADMILDGQFDTIYHEHISFFSVKSFASLAVRAGLNLVDVHRTPVHGTSFVFVLSKDSKDNSKYLMSKEKEITNDVISTYSKKCMGVVTSLNDLLHTTDYSKFKKVGYGAAAKGNTFLNFSKLKLDYIVDENKLKHNLYTPGSRIPIVPPEVLFNERDSVVLVPLAWNFYDEIKQKVNSNRKGTTIFLKYFPDIRIESE